MKSQMKFERQIEIEPGVTERHYRILVDGKPTEITRVYHISGDSLAVQMSSVLMTRPSI